MMSNRWYCEVPGGVMAAEELKIFYPPITRIFKY